MKLTEGKGWSLISAGAAAPAPAKKPNPQSPKPHIRLEKRAGKAVTVIANLHTYGSGRLEAMAKELKTSLGAGGTVKDGVIEIQGDRVNVIREWFSKKALIKKAA